MNTSEQNRLDEQKKLDALKGDSKEVKERNKAIEETRKVVTGKEYNKVHGEVAEDGVVVPEEATRVSGIPGRVYSTTPAGFETTTQTLPKNIPPTREELNRTPIHHTAPVDHLDRAPTTNKADQKEAAEPDQHDEKSIPRGQSVAEQFTSKEDKEKELEKNKGLKESEKK